MMVDYFYFVLFVLIRFETKNLRINVVGTGTVSVAAEPCSGKAGDYDMTTSNACAEHGKGKGQCCDSLYRHSLGRNDDDVINDNAPYESCFGIRGEMYAG